MAYMLQSEQREGRMDETKQDPQFPSFATARDSLDLKTHTESERVEKLLHAKWNSKESQSSNTQVK